METRRRSAASGTSRGGRPDAGPPGLTGVRTTRRRLAAAFAVVLAVTAGVGAAMLLGPSPVDEPRPERRPASAPAFADRVDAAIAAYETGDRAEIRRYWPRTSIVESVDLEGSWRSPGAPAEWGRAGDVADAVRDAEDLERSSPVSSVGSFERSEAVAVVFAVRDERGRESLWVQRWLPDGTIGRMWVVWTDRVSERGGAPDAAGTRASPGVVEGVDASIAALGRGDAARASIWPAGSTLVRAMLSWGDVEGAWWGEDVDDVAQITTPPGTCSLNPAHDVERIGPVVQVGSFPRTGVVTSAVPVRDEFDRETIWIQQWSSDGTIPRMLVLFPDPVSAARDLG